MRDLHYKLKGFRLNDVTIERLMSLRDTSDMSWNVLFLSLLDLEKKYGLQRLNDETKKKGRR